MTPLPSAVQNNKYVCAHLWYQPRLPVKFGLTSPSGIGVRGVLDGRTDGWTHGRTGRMDGRTGPIYKNQKKIKK